MLIILYIYVIIYVFIYLCYSYTSLRSNDTKYVTQIIKPNYKIRIIKT